MSAIYTLVVTVPLLAAAGGAAPAGNCGFANCDFEQGGAGWRVWYSDETNATITKYPWSVDDRVAHGGSRSLKIVAPDTNGRAFVHRSSSAVKPGGLYAVSYWFRNTPELDPKAFELRFNCWPENPPTPRERMIAVEPLITGRNSEGQWQQRRGYVRMADAGPMSVQLGLHLRGAKGTIWIDDVAIREVQPDDITVADLWEYNPYRVELGVQPVRDFEALRKAGDPILGRARRYNALLVRSAMVKEDVRRVRRLCYYTDDLPPQDAAALREQMDAAERRLAAVYRAYGRAFRDRQNAALGADFDRLADALGAELDRIADRAAASIARATQQRRDAGRQWGPPPALLDAGLPAITSDGRVNQIIYAKRSLSQFQEMEKPLGLDPVHSVSVYSPGTQTPGKYDWSHVDRQWAAVREAGIAKRTCLGTSMVLHDGCYAPPWLLKEAQDDPEILHVLRPPGELTPRGTSAQLNWWHPEVKRYVGDILADLGRTFADRDEFLFYVFQAECYGPYVASTRGLREVGYGQHAEADFRRWLKEKYTSIDRLNARWGAEYGSLEAVDPPADKYVEPRPHADPLAAEWEAWRERSYHDWRQLVYRTWKRADPNKPIVASHSQLYLRFRSPDEFDTCDMLGFHNRGDDFMPVTLYIHSISRYNGHKPLAQYENFWGVQEDHDRMGEELACRRSAQKHVFRLTAWSRFLQVWWYAYTTADYLTIYDGNWLDPSYALTTLRYRSAGLPVSFAKFKRLQRAMLESHVVPSRLCVLVPTASMRNNYPYDVTQTETRDLFRRLFPRNDLFELVPEGYFLDGRAKLDDFDALVLPAAHYLSEDLQKRILGWLEGGRRLLVSLGPCGVYDELGLDSGTLLDRVFGAGTLEFQAPTLQRRRWELVRPKTAATTLEGRLGDSQVVLVLCPVCDLGRDADGLVERIERHARRAAYDDANALEMVIRTGDSGRYLCVLNPSVDDRAETTVHVDGTFDAVTDLDYPDAFPVPVTNANGSTSFPLGLAPGEFTVLRLDP